MINYILYGLGLLILLIFGAGIRIVRPVERGLVERFGRLKRVAEPGFNWIIPIIDRIIKVNITEIRVDVDPQNIITQDKLNATVDAVVYYRILDPAKAIYKVNNFKTSVPSLARTTLRAVIGKMTLADANEKRDQINGQVEEELDKQTDDWGIDVIRVELQKIEPPDDVQNAMNEVVKAENKKIAAKDIATALETEADGQRRAEIKKAEGKRQGAILSAQGNKQAKILNAEGSREAQVLEAEGKAKAFKLIEESFTEKAQLLKKLDVTQNSLMNNSKIILTEKGITPQLIIGNLPTIVSKSKD